MYKLSEVDRRELKRLTQRANRRIESAMREYEKAGKHIIPKALSGGKIQVREEYHAPTVPFSRSTKFASKREFRRHMNELRRFDSPDKYRAANRIPTIKEYTKINQNKVITGINTALGKDITPLLERKLRKMNSVQLSQFWDKFEDKASAIGHPYSSDATMNQTLAEYFEEDIQLLIEG